MFKLLRLLLENLLGSAAGRVLSGAGLALFTSAATIPTITAALNAAAQAFAGVPGDMLNVILLFGFGQAISIIGAAVLTRAAITSSVVGLKKAASS
ncbi:DUF2523 domain-containing protein [Pseudoxanthomonas winnipegensis]|uniref:DUF2523 domain-containing protein n=1 Tax=Pseudoxanthomonas winnipegensis TaxID=2480810 RepID=A0A4Q8M0I8_9GAMM|nr:DUF2523 family protein [Pseudoxanthomonas winnipegensis]TAA37559.1 DUF2523 domain-containing protein [Pseudoxanthomonas winnipegensis]